MGRIRDQSDTFRDANAARDAHEMAALQQALKDSSTKGEFQRVLCIWLKRAFRFSSRHIATALGLTAGSVRRIQARYAREGIRSFVMKSRGGRRRENISIERERQILDKFRRSALRGATLRIGLIRRAYEVSVGRAVSLSTIYRLIERHDMRRFLEKPRKSRQKWL